LLTQLTPEPRALEDRLTATPRASTEPPASNTLVYPDPTPNPNVKPKVEPTDNAPNRRSPSQTTINPHSLQTPEASVPLRCRGNPHGWRGGPAQGIWGQGQGARKLNPLKRRRPTNAELEASDSTPDPNDSAHRLRLCPVDASRLNLDIHLGTALTNEGLAILHTESLVRVQTLCQMIAIMMMNLMTILKESAEESIHNSRGDADFLFVRADPQKIRRFEELPSVSEREAAGWQPTLDILATPMLQSVDEMPDTSYDYDTELYGDGES
ncbi:hypothetical protein Moror_9479, partial [Moniliophthora roreri MCA 2997]